MQRACTAGGSFRFGQAGKPVQGRKIYIFVY